jgi:hypothetical protein
MNTLRRIVAGLVVASVGMALAGCAATPTARVGPAPAYAAPISEDSVEARMRSIPTERVATRVRAESPGLEATESMLQDTLARYGYSISLEPIPWPSAESPAGWNNIVAEVRGNAKPEEVILVTAHFDAVPDSPGADDNASGVAGVMEVARRLSSSAFAEQTERTVRFVLFNVEEWGLHGAREHARLAALREGERIVGVINLEMIGYFTDEPGSQRSPIPRIPGVFDPPTVGDFIAIVANQSSSPFARELDTLMRSASPELKTLLVDFIPGNGRAVPDTRRSDHAPFWDMGVPAVMVTDTSECRKQNYHEPSDTVESLELERMTLVIRGVEHAVRVMSGAMAPRTTEAAR